MERVVVDVLSPFPRQRLPLIHEWRGVPEILHSDHGRNFKSRVIAAMCERLGIKKTRTTPLHPQGDGLVKRRLA